MIKPRFNTAAHFAPVETGVFFRSFGGSFVLKGGSSLYHLIEWLIPIMDGKNSLDSILGKLPEKNRPIVKKIIEQLMDHRIVRDTSADQFAQVDEETYEPYIEYIADYKDNPKRRFYQFQHSKILCIGSGEGFIKSLESLVRLGAQDLSINSAGYEQLVAREDQSDLISKVKVVPERETGFDVVLCIDHSHIPELSDVNMIIPIQLYEENAYVGPSILDGKQGFSLVPDEMERTTKKGGGHFYISPYLTLLAVQHATLEVFKYCAGLHEQMKTKETCIQLDTETLTSVELPIVEGYTYKDDDLYRVLELFQGKKERKDRKEFYDDAQALYNNQTGLVRNITPGDLPQLPRFTVRGEVAATKEKVIGTGSNILEAQYHVLVKGIKRYVKTFYDDHSDIEAYDICLDQKVGIKAEELFLSTGLNYEEMVLDGVQQSLLSQVVTHGKRLGSESIHKITCSDSSIKPMINDLHRMNESITRLTFITYEKIPSLLYVLLSDQSGMTYGVGADDTIEASIKAAIDDAINHLQRNSKPRDLSGITKKDQNRENELDLYSNQKINAYPSILGELSEGGARVIVTPLMEEAVFYNYGLLVGKVGVYFE